MGSHSLPQFTTVYHCEKQIKNYFTVTENILEVKSEKSEENGNSLPFRNRKIRQHLTQHQPNISILPMQRSNRNNDISFILLNVVNCCDIVLFSTEGKCYVLW